MSAGRLAAEGCEPVLDGPAADCLLFAAAFRGGMLALNLALQ
jgi:hypothetical protein